MSPRNAHLFLFCIFAMTCYLGDATGQETAEKPPATLLTGQENSSDQLRNEIEPGVVIYGKRHRFAEVGNCQSFDSSPDGRTLVFASNKLKFFDLIENKVLEQVGKDGEYYQHVSYSPDGRYVFANTNSSRNRIVRVFDAIDGSSRGEISTAVDDGENNNYFYLQSMIVSADAKLIALQSHNAVQVRDVNSGELVLHLKDLGYIQGLVFTPDEDQLVVSTGGKYKVYDVESGEPLEKSDSKLVNQYGRFVTVNLARELIAISSSNTITVYDTHENRKQGTIRLPPQTYGQNMAFSDDGALMAVSAWEQTSEGGKHVLLVVDVDQKKVLKKIKVPTQGITKTVFAVDNQSLFVSGHGIFGVKEIRLDEDESLTDHKYPSGPIQFAAIHPSGDSFLTCSFGGEVTWFDAATGEVTKSMDKANPGGLILTEDGSEAIIAAKWGSTDPIVRLNYETGETRKSYSIKAKKKGGVFNQIRSFMVKGGPDVTYHSQEMALSVKLSEDGSKINTVAMEMNYHMVSTGLGSQTHEQENSISFMQLDAESGKRLGYSKYPIEQFGFRNNEWVQTAAVHPEGIQFAVAKQSKITIVDAETGDVVDEFDLGNNAHVSNLEYSRGGKFMFATTHQSIWVWESKTGDEVLHVDPEFGAPNIAFSKDDSRMVLCPNSRNAEVVVYQTDSWKKLVSRKKTQDDRRSVSISPDGQKLLIGLGDCRMELWDLAVLKN